MELCWAAAWLEHLGYVHGDLRPNNLLLDGDDHLKLTDFDCAQKIGAPSSGNTAPGARFQGDEAGSERGTFGACGARTEQFAIGSVLYCMTRGHEPCEDEDESGPAVVQRFQDMALPALGGDGRPARLDGVVGRCWAGRYTSIAELAREAEALPGGAAEASRPRALSAGYLEECDQVCRRLVEGGLLEYDT